MKSKLNKAIEMMEHELQKMPAEQRKHIEVLLQAAKLMPLLNVLVEAYVQPTSYSDDLVSSAYELTRERTPEEVQDGENTK